MKLPAGISIRVGLTILLILITYNPTGFSFVHWVSGENGLTTNLPFKALAFLALVIAYAICVRATYRSIGLVGGGLLAAFLLAIGWVAYDIGIIDVANANLMQWLFLIGFGIILGIGLSWSIVRRRISGQVDVDPVGDGDHDHGHD